jgi:hypothetical protein
MVKSVDIIKKALKIPTLRKFNKIASNNTATRQDDFYKNIRKSPEVLEAGKKKLIRDTVVKSGADSIKQILDPRASYQWAKKGVPMNLSRQATQTEKALELATTTKQIKAIAKNQVTEQRGMFLQALTAGDVNSLPYKNGLKYYNMDTRGVRALHPEIFEHALGRQGWSAARDGTGTLDKFTPYFLQPKRPGGGALNFDLRNNDTVNNIKYTLYHGKRQRKKLHQVAEWFGDDWTNAQVNVIAKQLKLTPKEAKVRLMQGGGLPGVTLKNGRLYIDQVILSSDHTLGFTPITFEVRPNFDMKMLAHDVWDNGTAGGVLHAAWQNTSKILPITHSNVSTLIPSISNLRTTTPWKNIQNNVKQAYINPENKNLKGRKLLEAFEIGDHRYHLKASDEMLGKVENYVLDKVTQGQSPMRVLGEIQDTLSGPLSKDKINFLNELVSNRKVDLRTINQLNRSRRKSFMRKESVRRDANYEIEAEMPSSEKVRLVMSENSAMSFEEGLKYLTELDKAPISAEMYKRYLKKRILPVGAVALGGATFYTLTDD